MATTAEIHAAADRIASEGGSPTLARVRAAIGGGSFTTISEAMKLWKATRATASAAPMREAAPTVVAERMAEVAAEVWALALDLANQRLQVDRQALDVARAEAERGYKEAVEAADTISAELDAARGQIAAQAIALEQAARQDEKVQQELLSAREETAILRGRLEATQAQTDALMKLIATAQARQDPPVPTP